MNPAGAEARPELPADRFRGLVFRGVASVRERQPALLSGAAASGRSGSFSTASVPPPPFDPEEVAFVTLVLQRCGLDPRAYRIAPLIRRVTACLRALRLDSVDEACRAIGKCSEKATVAVNALLIGTTGFFRDAAVFEALEAEVIPALLARSPHPRVWSAACSDGAELYSVAMLLSEQGALTAGQLLGTDCREKSIRAGLHGIYPALAVEELGRRRIEQHFVKRGVQYEVAPALREATRWAEEDLVRQQPEFSAYDLILCRNVAIYLDPAAVQSLWSRLAASLSPGGYLMVGKAEKISLPGLHRTGPCIYVKTQAE